MTTPSIELRWPLKESRTTSADRRRGRESQSSSALQSTRAQRGSAKTSVRRSKGKHLNRREALLDRLGLTPQQVDASPAISPLLRQCGIHHERLIEVLRVDTDPDAAVVIGLWDALTPASRSLLGLEGLALAAKLTPRRLWEIYCGASLMQSRESVGAMIADALPAIMRVTIKQAKTAKGFTSREHILKAARVLPTPKGSVTNINLPAQNEPEKLESGSDDEGTLEEADGFLLATSRAMNKRLPAPKPVEVAAIEEEDDEVDGE